jgi:hypothetical protein
MKKMPFLVLALVFAAAAFLSACTLPARIEAPIPTAGEIDTSPPTLPTPTEAVELPELPTPTAAGELAPVDTPTSAPPVVTATTEPTQPPTSTPTVEPAPTEAPSAPDITPTRIQFQPGGTSTTVRGELNAGETAHYVLQASAGQTMRLNVWSPNSDVYLAVEGADGQKLVEAAEQKTQWSGDLPTTQDYVLHLNASGGMTSFSVTVEIPAVSGPAQPTATGAPPAATATPSPTGFDPFSAFGRPNWLDEMNSSSLVNWRDRDGRLPDTENIRMVIDNNQVFVTGKKLGFMTWYFSWVSIEDAFIQLTVETAACSGKDAYGIILRGPQHQAGFSNGYVVAFSCDGYYQIYRLDDADPFTIEMLVDWTRSEHIQAGQSQRNVIGVRAEGRTIGVYANGEKIAEVNDSRYPSGRIGLYIAAQNTANFTYRPVNMAYWTIE